MNAVRWLPRRTERGPWRSAVRQAVLTALFTSTTAAIASAAIEAPTGGAQTTPVRLAFVEGDALFWRPGAGDWEAAQVNIPLASGDALATRDGKLELQIGGRSFVRAAEGTQLRLKSNEPHFQQLEVSGGYVAIDVRDLQHGEAVEVDTPNATLRIARDGFYRIDVSDESTRLIVRRGGQATVAPAGGSVAEIATGEAVDIIGTDDAQLAALAAPPFDEWDRWNYDRADRFLAAPRAYAVSPDVYGGEELEQYGSWRYANTYGRVWAPYSVPAGWAPYTNGRWLWDPLYGWSWADYAPWGWAPFHYGRWVYAGYWAWAPGPVVAAPIYSPALVAFFGAPGFSVGIGVPFVSWVALGWGEPLVPWWGGYGFVGVPCWYGWGGPRVVNNIVINNGDVINANTVNIYRNFKAPGALVGVPKDQFDTRSLDRTRLTQINSGELKPLHGALPVAAKGPAGGAPAKMPIPDLKGQRSLAAAQRGGAAPPSNLSRGAAQPRGMERAGVPSVPGGTRTATGAKLGNASAGEALHRSGTKRGTTSALEALQRRGPGALSEPSRSQPALQSQRRSDLRRGQAPPAVPGGSKGATGSSFSTLRGRATSPRSVQSAPAPPARSTNVGRAQRPPQVRGAEKTGSSAGTYQRLRTQPSAPQARGAGKPGSSTAAVQRLRTEPPPPQPAARSAKPDTAGSGASSPPAPSRRLAAVSRESQTSGGAEKPAMPSMRAYQAPSRAAAPAPSMPSFGRSFGGGGSFSGGGAPSGGFNRGGGGGGGMSNFGRSGGGGGGAKGR